MPKQKKFATICNVTFDLGLGRTQKRLLEELITDAYCLIIGKIHARHVNFVAPITDNKEEMDSLKECIEDCHGHITENEIANVTSNKEWLKKTAVSYIVDRLQEIENDKDSAIIFGTRQSKFRNVTKEILRLRRYGEVYSELIGINNAPLNRELNKDLSQLNKFIHVEGYINK